MLHHPYLARGLGPLCLPRRIAPPGAYVCKTPNKVYSGRSGDRYVPVTRPLQEAGGLTRLSAQKG